MGFEARGAAGFGIAGGVLAGAVRFEARGTRREFAFGFGRAILAGLSALDDKAESSHESNAQRIMPGDVAVLLVSQLTFPGTRDERINQ